jgi:hypothetical protein
LTNKVAFIFLLLLLSFSSLIAQNQPNFRQKILVLSNSPQLLDTLSVVPESVIVHDFYTHQSICFSIKNDSISLNINQLDTMKTIIQYRVFPFSLKKKYALYDSLSTQRAGENVFMTTEKNAQKTLDAPAFLQYNGNYTRGISAGNAQNLALQSDFNLQLSG